MMIPGCEHVGPPDYENDPECVYCRSSRPAVNRQCREEEIRGYKHRSVPEVRADGLDEKEGIVMDSLVAAWNMFIKLERQHPSEVDEFAEGIHRCQYLLGIRTLRRDYPAGWPIKS